MNSRIFEQKVSEALQLLDLGKSVKAFLAFKELVKAAPRQPRLWMAYASAACGLGQLAAAEGAWKNAKELDPNNTENLLKIGHCYEAFRCRGMAMSHFEEAARSDPLAINPRISQALLHEKLHHLDAARRSVEECLAIDARDEQATYLSALLDSREEKFEKAEERLRDLIASDPKHEYVRYAARYKLAEILDRTGRYAEAMDCLKAAKVLVAGLADMEVLARQYESTAQALRERAKQSPKNCLRAWARKFPEKSRSTIPHLVFLGGHPRSGTTLLEKVLGSHPEVGAIDEPMTTQIAKEALSRQPVGSWIPQLNLARQRYIQCLTQALPDDRKCKVLLEKNPSPTASLPILLKVFPELRVIVALRDPRDVVLSCYFQNIPLNATNANFLTFERCVKHYRYLMDVWLAVREWEAFSWIETKYEDVVVNHESELRHVTQFTGVEWHAKQGQFFSENGAVYSPTYHDVTQPIYPRSLARWRNYLRYLEPFFPDLEPYCRAFGYS
jgi:tetratricopeptide (TPR) repeat protein